MDPKAALALYDRSMRALPFVPDDWRVEADGVVRVVGHWCGVTLTDLDEGDADRAIAAEIAYFAALAREFEWKVHAHDRPADLGLRLAGRGFAPDPVETLLAIEVGEEPVEGPAVQGLVIRVARDEAGLRDYVAGITLGFESDRSGAFEEFVQRLDDPTVELHVAYLDGAPVGGGRLDLPPGDRPFAGLYSGAVAPAARGLGVYRALVASRLKRAWALSYPFAMVEALPTSRPILERLGFTPLTTVQGWIWRPT